MFNFSSSTRFAGIAYTQMMPAGTIQPLGLAKEGLNSYVGFDSRGRNRWGDYNGIARDPLNSNRFFFNAMYAKSTVNTSGTYVASTIVSTPTAPASSATTLAGVNPAGGAGGSASAAQISGIPNSVEVPAGIPGAIGFGPFQSPLNRPRLPNDGAIYGLPADGRDE